MRLLVALLAVVCISEAAPRSDRLARAERVRERVRKAIEFLRSAKSFGEFAINTPYGLIPVGDITESNLPDVFRFRREFDDLRTEDKAAIHNLMSPSTTTTTAPKIQHAAPAASLDDTKVEGSGEVEGSGHSDEGHVTVRFSTVEAHPKLEDQQLKKDHKREDTEVFEESLLTPGGATMSRWDVPVGKFAPARIV